jgi:hypothetical protein
MTLWSSGGVVVYDRPTVCQKQAHCSAPCFVKQAAGDVATVELHDGNLDHACTAVIVRSEDYRQVFNLPRRSGTTALRATR